MLHLPHTNKITYLHLIFVQDLLSLDNVKCSYELVRKISELIVP